jgi:F0F1-type ATP synthase membrane subunit c/vacuolar-type H+-ATPase subunit K
MHDMAADDKAPKHKKPTRTTGTWIGTGIAIGIGIGIAMDNLAVGIAIGVALGAAIGASRERKTNKSSGDEQ